MRLQVIANAEDDRLALVARFCLECLPANTQPSLRKWHRLCEQSRRLEEIPGIGPIVATALAEIGDWKRFRSGRGLAAWIELVPKQHYRATWPSPALLPPK
jgi:transposase